uniref:Uncharacterized protein n=1 Tax=Pseudomonas phage HRDY3 TaxID=3236930 RepID=A0AB39CEB1_9VIRU
MNIPVWALAILLACALFVLWRWALPRVLRFVLALMGFFWHLSAAKLYKMPTGPIWALAPHYVLRAYQNRNDYTTSVRHPDIAFNYRYGVLNCMTQDEKWLDELATALWNGRHYMNVTVIKNEPDLKVNETMECVVGVLPANEDSESVRALILHPMSNTVESVIGFDLKRLLKTVAHYMPDVEAVVIHGPRSMIDRKWNTIEYLAALDGRWHDIDHLAFKIPRDHK